MDEPRFAKTLEPANIGRLTLKNRIVMPPIGTNYAERDGSPSQRMIDYYEARARGGVGLIIVEGSAPSLQSTMPHQASLGDDRFISGWRRLTEHVHRHGAGISIQIMHSTMEYSDGTVVQVSPSAIMVPARFMGISGELPHELTVDEIGERVRWFSSAAMRAREAGFDGAEIHGAHQYLVAAFLSSATNQRKDRYGGSVRNRARFLVEILHAIRDEVGPSFPVWVRLNAREWGVDNGVTLEETREVVQWLVEAGSQAIHVSGYGAGSYITSAPIADTPGFLVPLASEVKTHIDVPVIAVGRLDLELGEGILEEGKADLIAIGRRLMADPGLPNKMAQGMLEEVTPCIGCMECIERLLVGKRSEGVICVVNPSIGRENEYRIEPAVESKNVLVVGGGPAGMQAAIVAARRGHTVTLFEKDERLGGQLNVAVLPPFKHDISPWIDYMVHQVHQAGVEVELRTNATADTIAKMNADAVVIATGATPIMPAVPGVDRPNVVAAEVALSGKAGVGQNVVIIGGGMVGCETGHYLAEQGRTVTIVEMLKRIANDMFLMTRRRLIDGLRQREVTLLTSTICKAINVDGVCVTSAEGEMKTILADTVIVAVGYEPDLSLYRALEGKAAELVCIGDASGPGRIMEAVQQGYRAGLAL